jgi:anaerobic C4-dicarboxylate transporter DcuA
MSGGLGVLVLGLVGAKVSFDDIPFDVIGIIMSVIAAIAAMQMAGGLDWVVAWADKLLRKRPERITLYAPLVTYFMTVLAGTGHTAFSTLPVIAEVAKENGIRPSRPLSISVVASQLAITASPVSAAVVYMASELEPKGVSYLQLLGVAIPSTHIAVIAITFIANKQGKPLDKDPEYQRRLAEGKIVLRGPEAMVKVKGAVASVVIFLVGIVWVMLYATMISPSVGLIEDPTIDRTCMIMVTMLTVATAIIVVCKVHPEGIISASTFKSGMNACLCVLGVAWLGTTFVQNNIEGIQNVAGNILQSQPWLLAVVLFFASALLYSQASTAKAIMPAAFALGVSPLAAVAAFPAVSGLFVLPTYPTLIAAVEMDDTGSTRIGKYVFNHPFMIPGVLTIATSVALGFLFGSFIL